MSNVKIFVKKTLKNWKIKRERWLSSGNGV